MENYITVQLIHILLEKILIWYLEPVLNNTVAYCIFPLSIFEGEKTLFGLSAVRLLKKIQNKIYLF